MNPKPDNRQKATELMQRWAATLGVEYALSFDMPAGFDTANATYVPQRKTICLNPALTEEDDISCAFYLLHELRHAWQHQRRQELPEDMARSLDYVILYDGTCYKQHDGNWLECRLEGDEEYFTDLYTNLPYEVDANEFAYQGLLPGLEDRQRERLEELCSLWAPRNQVISLAQMPDALEKTYRRIDAAVKAQTGE